MKTETAYSVSVWQLAQQLCSRRRKQVAPVRAPPKAFLFCRHAEEEYDEETRLPAADSVGGAQLQAAAGNGRPHFSCIFAVVCVWYHVDETNKKWTHTTPPPMLLVEERTAAGRGGGATPMG